MTDTNKKAWLAHTHTLGSDFCLWKSRCQSAWAASKLARSFSMELSSADQIEQEFADELQNMSIKEEAALVKKPSLARAHGTDGRCDGEGVLRQRPTLF